MEPPGTAGMLKTVYHSDDVSVRNMHENMPVKIEESHIQELSVAERKELARAFGHDKVCCENLAIIMSLLLLV